MSTTMVAAPVGTDFEGYPVTPGDVLARLTRPGVAKRTLSGICDLFLRRGRQAVRPRAVMQAVLTLEKVGQVTIDWDAPTEPVVCLTAHTAEEAGLVLDRHGRRWRTKGTPEQAIKQRHRAQTRTINLGDKADTLPDPKSPSPGWSGWAGDGLPVPTVLLGERLQWHGPRWCAKRPCPGCSGERAAAGRYCLVCSSRKT